jgi:hypothetical protein
MAKMFSVKTDKNRLNDVQLFDDAPNAQPLHADPATYHFEKAGWELGFERSSGRQPAAVGHARQVNADKYRVRVYAVS